MIKTNTADAISTLKEIKKARLVFICGNGGSAATAEHFTNDLFKKGIKAICLNSNVSVITMIANDYGYDQIFSRQLELYAQKGDMIILFSVSGKSPNILKALEVINAKHISTTCFFGQDGWTSYGKVENDHLAVAHEIAEAL